MLHITNGESVICSFEAVSMPGTYLSWRDILHEGPVPATDTLDALSDIRARFVADSGWTTYEDAREQLAQRDGILANSHKEDEVILWFEHDLFDQLQLIQVLDWFHRNPPLPGRLSLIHPEGYLGAMPGEVLEAVFPLRRTVHSSQLELASRAWQAFTASNPSAVLEIAGQETPPLPYLQGNFERFLEEYPSARNGLSRSQEQILKAVADGARTPEAVFEAFCEYEEPIFMGDSSVFNRIDGLMQEPAVIQETANGYELTALGRELLECRTDWIRSRGHIDIWLGGVHLQGPDAAWRWDSDRKTLIALE